MALTHSVASGFRMRRAARSHRTLNSRSFEKLIERIESSCPSRLRLQLLLGSGGVDELQEGGLPPGTDLKPLNLPRYCSTSC